MLAIDHQRVVLKVRSIAGVAFKVKELRQNIYGPRGTL